MSSKPAYFYIVFLVWLLVLDFIFFVTIIFQNTDNFVCLLFFIKENVKMRELIQITVLKLPEFSFDYH